MPGLAASEQYAIRRRSPRAGGEWQPVFTWETRCKSIEPRADGSFDTLAGWTHTSCNFETAGPVEVEIARVDGRPGVVRSRPPRRTCSRAKHRLSKTQRPAS